jgi:glucuronokinase
MICIILVAGHGFVLEKEIQEDESGDFEDLVGVPKALLPAHPHHTNESILDKWWSMLNSRQQFSEIYIVTNADKYKHYERWATAHGFPVENIVNDGSTMFVNSLGAVADLQLVIRSKGIQDDIMVVAGDMLYEQDFDIGQVLKYFSTRKGDLAVYYEMEPEENPQRRGIMEVDSASNRITKFFEKPSPGVTESRNASVVFYCFHQSTLPLFSDFLSGRTDKPSFGHFMSWLLERTEVHGMKIPSGFQLIGQVSLQEYRKWVTEFSNRRTMSKSKGEPIVSRTYARVGLMGNPSDGFYGKTISLSIANFWAEVTLIESPKLKLVPHPLNDPTEFGGLSDLHGISRKEGYLGGLRLLQATCKKFYQYCVERGIALAKKNFTLKYDTNIPRQVGLAGSSAIVTSTLNCLMKFYNLTEFDLPREQQPGFILNVEKSELFIQAGLQDRVIQVYGGMVYMDFNKEHMDNHGYGIYEPMDKSKVPPLWLAYVGDPSDSGDCHVTIM